MPGDLIAGRFRSGYVLGPGGADGVATGIARRVGSVGDGSGVSDGFGDAAFRGGVFFFAFDAASLAAADFFFAPFGVTSGVSFGAGCGVASSTPAFFVFADCVAADFFFPLFGVVSGVSCGVGFGVASSSADFFVFTLDDGERDPCVVLCFGTGDSSGLGVSLGFGFALGEGDA